jgi:hypothetical protein
MWDIMKRIFIRFIISILSFVVGVVATLQWFSARQLNPPTAVPATLHSSLPQVLSDFQLVGNTVQGRWIFPHGTQAQPFPQRFEPGQNYILHYSGTNRNDMFSEMFTRFGSMGFEVFDAVNPGPEHEAGVLFRIGFRDDLYEGYFQRYWQTPEEVRQSMLNTKRNFPDIEANEGEPCGNQDYLLLITKRKIETVESTTDKQASSLPEVLKNFQLLSETAHSRWIYPLDKEAQALPQKFEAGRQYILRDPRHLFEAEAFEELLNRFHAQNIEVFEADDTSLSISEGVVFHFGFRDGFYEGYLDRVETPPEYIMEIAWRGQRYLPYPINKDQRALSCYVLVITKAKAIH